MVGHFSTPITPESESFLHADSQLQGFIGVTRSPSKKCFTNHSMEFDRESVR